MVGGYISKDLFIVQFNSYCYGMLCCCAFFRLTVQQPQPRSCACMDPCTSATATQLRLHGHLYNSHNHIMRWFCVLPNILYKFYDLSFTALCMRSIEVSTNKLAKNWTESRLFEYFIQFLIVRLIKHVAVDWLHLKHNVTATGSSDSSVARLSSSCTEKTI